MGGEGWRSEARKTKPFKNSYYKPGTLWDSLLKNTQLVKKSDETDWRPDQSVVSRGYKVKWLTEEVLN